MSASFTRVFSDIHFYDGSSRVRDLAQLEPLLEDVPNLVLNGDTLDTQRTPDPVRALAELKAFFLARVANTVFVTGNHDPIISPTHELSLCEGRIWITHGDILFDAIAPWSVLADRLRQEVLRLRQGMPPEALNHLPSLLLAHREVARTIHVEFDTARGDRLYRWWRLFRSVFPPKNLLSILEVWRDMPALGAAFAERHRPHAQVILFGHNHAPHVGTYGGRVVINTGSFCPPRSAFCADIYPEGVTVRKILKKGRAFHPGPVIAEFPLANPVAPQATYRP